MDPPEGRLSQPPRFASPERAGLGKGWVLRPSRLATSGVAFRPFQVSPGLQGVFTNLADLRGWCAEAFPLRCRVAYPSAWPGNLRVVNSACKCLCSTLGICSDLSWNAGSYVLRGVHDEHLRDFWTKAAKLVRADVAKISW